MIATLNDDKSAIVFNEFKVKYGMKKEIEYLHHLYSTVNFELGYIQNGMLWFHPQKPKKRDIVTRDDIQTFDSWRWGNDGIMNRSGTARLYPVEYFTTRAKNTLILIRQLLKKDYDNDVALSKFFTDSSKEVHKEIGILQPRKFDLSMQIQKLEHILNNPEIALSLLEDAYLDFYLFVDFLTKVNIKSEIPTGKHWIDFLGDVAVENTEILNVAKKFVRLREIEDK